jgi:hypothetical protein
LKNVKFNALVANHQAGVNQNDIDSSDLKKLNEEIWKKIPKEQVILPIGEINQGTENRYTEV